MGISQRRFSNYEKTTSPYFGHGRFFGPAHGTDPLPGEHRHRLDGYDCVDA